MTKRFWRKKIKTTDNQAPAPITEEKSKDWFKVLQIIIGFLIVLGLFGNIYLLLRKEKQKPISQITPTPTQTSLPRDSEEVLRGTPTPDETANWKTYRNGKYGYELKYPLNWFLVEMPTGVTGGVDMLYSYEPPEIQVKDPEFWKGKLKMDIGKMISKKRSDQSLIEWFENYEKEPGGQMLTKMSQEVVVIDGRNAIKVTSKLKTGEGNNISYFIENNDNIYFISAGNDFNPQNQKIFNLILSTFKFLD